ncbi:MAG: ATP phosphoribosyltransferase regulatory subunit [Clostridia bacterium]|nr:ATP phosphoribosyltransferase regulatory subunit [Clostridia bacterium]
MPNKIKLSIPQGMRDWLPGEAYRKRDLINKLLKQISLWGYEEINTPMLEYYQVLLPDENWGGAEQIYKLVERDGRILALRSEMTLPIARVVSSKLPAAYPWRLMYGGEVFRYEEIQTGRQREFSQVGVELIGAAGEAADSEIVALAIETLRAAGLDSFTVSLGHTGVLRGLLESLSWEDAQLDRVRALILEKDFVSLGSYLLSAGMKEKRIQHLVGFLTCQLSPNDLVKEGRDLPQGILEALADLQKIISFLKRYGYERYVQVDLSTLRSQEYYTGMVFEIYTPGIGYPIGGGGRYDQLLHNWGTACPATGFALGVERILLSLPQEEKAKKEKPLLLVGTDAGKVISKALQLRKEGKRVFTEIGELSRWEAEKLALSKGAVLSWCGGENADEA